MNKNYILLLLCLLLFISGPLLLVFNNPSTEELRLGHLLYYSITIIGCISFLSLGSVLLLNKIFKGSITFLTSIMVILTSFLIEIFVLWIPLYPILLIIEKIGLSERLTFLLVDLVMSILAWLMYSIAGYTLYFKNAEKRLSASITLGLIRSILVIIFFRNLF